MVLMIAGFTVKLLGIGAAAVKTANTTLFFDAFNAGDHPAEEVRAHIFQTADSRGYEEKNTELLSTNKYYIDEFYVDSDLQGQGVGSKMLREIGPALKNRGVNAIILATERDYPAQRFYEKNGFEVLDTTILMGMSIS